jgi:glutathione S-transferase
VQLANYNPLRRVPTLVLDDGEVLIESTMILDWLDELTDPDRRMISASGASRRAALKVCALASGLCDKMVSLVFERVLHEALSEIWVARCETQIRGVLDILEADHARLPSYFWFGAQPGHADIAVACALRFLAEAHPTIHASGIWPELAEHSARCEDMKVFRAVVQHFVPPR